MHAFKKTLFSSLKPHRYWHLPAPFAPSTVGLDGETSLPKENGERAMCPCVKKMIGVKDHSWMHILRAL